MADHVTAYSLRLCLSGVESRQLLETFRDFGVRHIQASYYYLRRVFPDPGQFEEFAKPFTTVLIDSGTYYHKYKTDAEKQQFLRDYQGYLAALDKKSFTAAVSDPSLQLDSFLPDEMIIYPLDEMRETLDNDLKSIFSMVKYVGVSYKEASNQENLLPIFAQAQKQGTWVHAFGTSSKRILGAQPFYSANSSSWRTGSRYLNTYLYEGVGRPLKLIQPTDKSDPEKTQRELLGVRTRQRNLMQLRYPALYEKIDWEELLEGDSWEVDKGNLVQWIQYQRDQEVQVHTRYFLDADQQEQVLFRKRQLIKELNPALKDKSGDISSNATDNVADMDEDVQEAEVVGMELAPISESQLAPRNIGGRAYEVDSRMRVLRQCDFCSLATQCPKYTPDGDCAYGFGPESADPDPDNLEEVIRTQFADNLILLQDSIQHLAMQERLQGTGASKDLTQRMKLWADMIQQMSEAMDTRDEVSIKAKGHGILDSFTKGGRK